LEQKVHLYQWQFRFQFKKKLIRKGITRIGDLMIEGNPLITTCNLNELNLSPVDFSLTDDHKRFSASELASVAKDKWRY